MQVVEKSRARKLPGDTVLSPRFARKSRPVRQGQGSEPVEKRRRRGPKGKIEISALAARSDGNYILRLFVAGATARSRQAVLCVRELCNAELKRGCKLEVIDIYQQPSLARKNQIVATPTLIKEFPRPVCRFIGSLSNITVLFGELDLDTTDKIGV